MREEKTVGSLSDLAWLIFKGDMCFPHSNIMILAQGLDGLGSSCVLCNSDLILDCFLGTTDPREIGTSLISKF